MILQDLGLKNYRCPPLVVEILAAKRHGRPVDVYALPLVPQRSLARLVSLVMSGFPGFPVLSAKSLLSANTTDSPLSPPLQV